MKIENNKRKFGDHRKEQLKKFGVHFGGNDIVIDNFVLAPVHELPEGQWDEGREIDFYMDDGLNIYLLRVVNGDEQTISFVDDNFSALRYIIVKVPVNETDDALKKIITGLKDFPYTQMIDG